MLGGWQIPGLPPANMQALFDDRRRSVTCSRTRR
jgi:hypothetical protein